MEHQNVLERMQVKKNSREEIAKKKYEADEKQFLEFQKWLENSLPSDKYCYYTGSTPSANRVAALARSYYTRGLITMYMKREPGNSVFSYWALRRRDY